MSLAQNLLFQFSMERPAPISFKLNGPKKKIKSVLFVGDSHIAKLEKEAHEGCKLSLLALEVRRHTIGY